MVRQCCARARQPACDPAVSCADSSQSAAITLKGLSRTAELQRVRRVESWLAVLVAVAGVVALGLPAGAAPTTTSTTVSPPTTLLGPGTPQPIGFDAPLPLPPPPPPARPASPCRSHHRRARRCRPRSTG